MLHFNCHGCGKLVKTPNKTIYEEKLCSTCSQLQDYKTLAADMEVLKDVIYTALCGREAKAFCIFRERFKEYQ